MKFNEETIKSECVFDGKVIQTHVDQAKRADGLELYREVVKHPGGVSVAVEDEEGMFILVRQWRYAQGRVMLEFPAGKKELNEEPIVTGKREVIEETGYNCSELVDMGCIVPTGAYDSEIIYLYYAKAKEFVGTNFDEDEYLELVRYSLEELEEMILNNTIQDAKTIALVFKIRKLKESGQI